MGIIAVALEFATVIDEITIYVLHSSGVLTHPIRHRVISILVDHDAVEWNELAEMIAIDESVPYDDRDQIEIALVHNHLPRLDDEQLIQYDQRSGDATLFTDSGIAVEMLESAQGFEN